MSAEASLQDVREGPIFIVRSAHEYLAERWTVADFVDWRVDLTEARLLERGYTLKAIREARTLRFRAAVAARLSAGFETSNAYDAYIAFRHRVQISKRTLLDDLPVLVKVEKHREYFVANIRCREEKGPIRGALYGKNKDKLWLIAVGFLASEFSDEIALVLGDTPEVRLFALRLLLLADSYSREPKRIKGAAKVRMELAQITRLSGRLQKAMQKAQDSWLLIEGAVSENAPLSSQWPQFTTLLEQLSEAASRAASELPVRKGRISNSAGNYTPLMMVANAWRLSFGANPSASPRSRFMSVAGYCLLLFTHGTVDVRAGLKHWKEATEGGRHLGIE